MPNLKKTVKKTKPRSKPKAGSGAKKKAGVSKFKKNYNLPSGKKKLTGIKNRKKKQSRK